MNIVIVEDSEMIRDQLLRLVDALPGIHVVATASNEPMAIAQILTWQPEVVLLDLSLSPGNGVNVLEAIRKAGVRSRVLVLTNHASNILRKACEGFGIAGFYDKSHEVYACIDHLNSLAPAFPGLRP